MNRLAKLSARFIGNRGFSIGIDDVSPAPDLQEAKEKLVRAGYAGRSAALRSDSNVAWRSQS
jgi:DNA-directed RNA polymerase III subunit RPC1